MHVHRTSRGLIPKTLAAVAMAAAILAAPCGCGGGGGQTGASTGGSSGAGDSPGTGGVATTGTGGTSTPATGGSSGGTGSGPANGTGTGGTVGTGGATGGSGAAGTNGGRGGAAPATGGTTGVAGTTGSGGGAAAGHAGTASCPSGTFICEDFEAYPAGAAPNGIWSKNTRAGGTIAVDATRAFSGTNALHVTGTINGDAAHITTPISGTGNTTFVRFMMYTLGYPSSSGVHSHLARIGTVGDSGPDSAYSLSSFNGTAIEKVDSIYLRDTSTHLNDANMKNRWVCLEFEIDKTGGIGKVVPHIWVDSKELTLAPAGSSTHAGTSSSWESDRVREVHAWPGRQPGRRRERRLLD